MICDLCSSFEVACCDMPRASVRSQPSKLIGVDGRRANARIKWFNGQKGYGLVQPDDGGDNVFVHISAVQASQSARKSLIRSKSTLRAARAAPTIRRSDEWQV